MKWDYTSGGTEYDFSGNGLFIVCEGNFQYGNSTLSYYDPVFNEVYNEVFFQSNEMKLGDVAQSMTIYDNKGWIVVNNSHVIFAINPDTFKEVGRIENLTSPRFIHFISEEKAYVSQIWDNRIYIVNPQTYSISGYITVPDMTVSSGSTEQMVQIGKYVFCNCWSYQNRIIKIDSETDRIVDQISVGIQPNSLIKDKYNRLWTITDGGYDLSPYGYEAPAIYCINSDDFSIEKVFYFKLGDTPSKIYINEKGDTLYWINEDVWKMNIDSISLPTESFIASNGTKYYALTLNPENEEVYVADAIDYSQQGIIYRYSYEGMLLDEFYVGVTPGAFCWKFKE